MDSDTTPLDRTFHALSHDTRRDILRRLSRKAFPVTELASFYPCSLNGVSKHVRVLERAGLVRRTREGRVHRLNLQARPLKEALECVQFFRRFWEQSFDALEEYLAGETQEPSIDPHHSSPSRSPL